MEIDTKNVEIAGNRNVNYLIGVRGSSNFISGHLYSTRNHSKHSTETSLLNYNR